MSTNLTFEGDTDSFTNVGLKHDLALLFYAAVTELTANPKIEIRFAR
jgi:hypothetical protein